MSLSLKRILAVFATFTALALAAPAHADIQKSGSEVFPGKLAVGVFPLGVQAGFNSSTSGYKLSFDFAGLIKSTDKLSIWLGGAFSYAYPTFNCGAAVVVNGTVVTGNGDCAHDIGLEAFVRITLEKLVKIPLVPYVEAGIGGDFMPYFDGRGLGGAVAIPRFGGGAEYYLTKNIGLGLRTDFAFGPGIYRRGDGSSFVGFWGNWDFLMGARFAF